MPRDRRVLRSGLALSAVLVAVAPAAAQPAEGTPKKEGEYGGVNPGASPSYPTPPNAKAQPPPAKEAPLMGGLPSKPDGSPEPLFPGVEPVPPSQPRTGRVAWGSGRPG